MTYGLGRSLEYADMPTVRRIVRDAEAERLPVFGDRARHREEHAVSDEGPPAEARYAAG